MIKQDIKSLSLAASYFVKEWYNGGRSKVKVIIVGNQVYIDSTDNSFELFSVELLSWIFALRAEESRLIANIFKTNSEFMVGILERIEAIYKKANNIDLKKIISTVKYKSNKALN